MNIGMYLYYIWIRMYLHIYVYIYIYIFTRKYRNVFVRRNVRVCIYIYMYVCIYIYTYVCVCIYIYIHMLSVCSVYIKIILCYKPRTIFDTHPSSLAAQQRNTETWWPSWLVEPSGSRTMLPITMCSLKNPWWSESKLEHL